MHIITASAGAVRNVSTCIQRCHLEPAAFVVSPYASGLASLVDDELELGAPVIDMGGGATTIAVFYEHNVIFTDVIPVGGNHAPSDIARGLSPPLVHSERMKPLSGHAITAPPAARARRALPQVAEVDGQGA